MMQLEVSKIVWLYYAYAYSLINSSKRTTKKEIGKKVQKEVSESRKRDKVETIKDDHTPTIADD